MRTILTVLILSGFIKTLAQVNPQNGAAVYEIPIFSHTVPKSHMGHGISLVYNSGNGIKVNQQASCTGEGWTLQAGGFIQRIQKEQPDDQFQIENIAVDNTKSILERQNPNAFSKYYPNGYRYSTFPLTELPKENFFVPRFENNTTASTRYLSSPRALADRQQDIFIFSVNGKAGEFVIGKNGTIRVLNESKLKVSILSEFDLSEMIALKVRTKIKAFTIQDEDGTTYEFKSLELTNVIRMKEKSYDGSGLKMKVEETEALDQHIVTRWFLSEIISPFDGSKILFQYNDISLNSLIGIEVSHQSAWDHPNFTQMYSHSEAVHINEYTSFFKLPHLSKIIFPDGFTTEFEYNTRYDLNAGYYLWKVKMKYKDEIFQESEFKYKYFYKEQLVTNLPNPIYEKRFLRLCLDQYILKKKSSPTNDLVYQFDYYLGTLGSAVDIVPPVHTFAQDGWGYFNGDAQVLPSNPQFYDKNAIKSFLYTTAVVNPRRAIADGLAKNGLLKAIVLPTGGSINFEYEQNDCLNKNNQYKKVGGVRVSKVVLKDNVSTNPDQAINYKYLLANGTTSGWGYDEPIQYEVRQVSFLDKSNFEKMGILAAHLLMRSNTAENNIASNIHQLGINYSNYFSPATSFEEDLTHSILTLIKMLLTDTYTAYYAIGLHLTSQNLRNSIPLQYSRVEITKGDGNVGKSILEFTKPVNYSAEIADLPWPYTVKPRSKVWRYGLLNTETILSNTGAIVRKTENTYNEVFATLDDNFKSINTACEWTYSGRYDRPAENETQLSSFSYVLDAYNLQAGRSYLTQTKVEERDKNNLSTESNTYFDYATSTNTLPRETYSYNSKGDKIGKTIYYVSDYTISTGPIHELKQKNALALPITTLNWIVRQGTTDKLFTGITVNEYELVNSKIRLKNVHSAHQQAPHPSSMVGSFNPNSIFISYPGLMVVRSNFYDSENNLIAVTDENSRKLCFINDYEGSFQVASVSNAEPDDIAYTSFETNYTGNWIIQSPIREYGYNNAITGRNILRFDANGSTTITKNQLNPSKTYVLTYWSQSGPLQTTISASPVVLYAVNGWTLYSQTFTGLASITLTGNGHLVDEVRLSPRNSRMKTLAFDPGVGKNSECDENNRSVYYEYDNLGRLVMVQDQNRNAVKTYEYHTKTSVRL